MRRSRRPDESQSNKNYCSTVISCIQDATNIAMVHKRGASTALQSTEEHSRVFAIAYAQMHQHIAPSSLVVRAPQHSLYGHKGHAVAAVLLPAGTRACCNSGCTAACGMEPSLMNYMLLSLVPWLLRPRGGPASPCSLLHS